MSDSELKQDYVNAYALNSNIDGLEKMYNESELYPDYNTVSEVILNGLTDVLEFLEDIDVKLTDEQILYYYNPNTPDESRTWIYENYLDFVATHENDSENLGRDGTIHVDRMQSQGFLLDDIDEDNYSIIHNEDY